MSKSKLLKLNLIQLLFMENYLVDCIQIYKAKINQYKKEFIILLIYIFIIDGEQSYYLDFEKTLEIFKKSEIMYCEPLATKIMAL